jgi:hypothetical protein
VRTALRHRRAHLADRDVRVVSEDGGLIRQLTIDPSRDYQGLGLG